MHKSAKIVPYKHLTNPQHNIGELSIVDVVLWQIFENDCGNKICSVQIVRMPDLMRDSKKSTVKMKLRIGLLIKDSI